MKTKSLGELLSDALDKAWGHKRMWGLVSSDVRELYDKTGKLFLKAVSRQSETTSKAVATKAGKALRSKRTSKVGKSIAASALTQARRKSK